MSEGVHLPLGLSQPGVLTGVVLLGVVENMLLRAELERMEEVARARRRAAGDRPERSRSGEGVNPALGWGNGVMFVGNAVQIILMVLELYFQLAN